MQPIANQVYTQGGGTFSTDGYINVIADRDPSGSDVNYPIQKRWINSSTRREFILIGYLSVEGQLEANWLDLGSGAASTETLTGNSGGAVGPDGDNNINTLGDATTINIVGNPGSNTLTANVILPAKHDVLVSGGSSIVGVAPSATAGIPLVSDIAGNDPVFGIAKVQGGGTGRNSLDAYAVICGGITSTDDVQQVVGLGDAGQFLQSRGLGSGSGALPVWADVKTGNKPWIDQTTSFDAASGTGYFCSGTLTATLDGAAVQGDTISFLVETGGGVLTIQAGPGQTIKVSTASSSVVGTCESSTQGDSITLVYRSFPDFIWYATSVVGSWTLN